MTLGWCCRSCDRKDFADPEGAPHSCGTPRPFKRMRVRGSPFIDPLVTPRDPKRIMRILSMIQIIWNRNPDWRLGQLLVNVHPPILRSPFFMEDDDLETALRSFLGEEGGSS